MLTSQTKKEKSVLPINLRLELFTLVSGKEVSVMVLENSSGQMVLSILENGVKTEHMGRVNLFT